MASIWKLEGLDGFDAEAGFYPLGEYDDRAAAEAAADARLVELEQSQPTKRSGGQSGIQDRVFVVSPDGVRTRYLGAC